MASSRRPAGPGPRASGAPTPLAQDELPETARQLPEAARQLPETGRRVPEDGLLVLEAGCQLREAGRRLAEATRRLTRRPKTARSRPAAYLAVAAVLAGLAVAGCGSVTAGTSGSGSAAGAPRSGSGGAGTGGAGTAGQDATGSKLVAGSALCAHPAEPRRVLIVRTGIVRVLEGGKRAQPAGSLPPAIGSRPGTFKTVTNPGEVHGLARALCALPKMPRGPLPCPAQFPGSYQFYFTADGLRLPVVVVQESGCRAVTGLGPVRRADQPAFWRLLTHIVSTEPLTPSPGSPGSVQPGGPDLPGSGLVTGCEPTPGQPLRACPFRPNMPHKPWA